MVFPSRPVSSGWLAVLLATAGACTSRGQPCMSMSPPGELVQRAAILRLDVYDGSAPCAGATIAPRAPPPSPSNVVADGLCAAGCKAPGDCAAGSGGGGGPLCDLLQHRCVACLGATDCPAGTRCSAAGSCVDGCDVAAGSLCPGAIACCSNLCIDTQKS